MSDLELEVKELIIDALSLDDVTANEIDSAAPLFGEGLGLDSIDALELGIALKKKYNILIESDNANTKKHFESVNNLVSFIRSQQGE